MKIGAILPHLGMYGGIRRFMELGNTFTERGINYTIFSNKEQSCTWFDFKGRIRNWSNIESDYLLIGDPPSFGILPKAKGKIFIYVIAGGKFIPIYRRVYGKYPFILNNRVFKKYFPESHFVEGAVNIDRFRPGARRIPADETRVLYYDRKGKGVTYIRNALRDIEGIRLIGLKGLDDKTIAEAYRNGDFFVSWEKREGWSNTTAEALASGLTVVTNGVNCEPFIEKTIKVNDLREFFLSPTNRKMRKRSSMEEFSWEHSADQLLELMTSGHK